MNPTSSGCPVTDSLVSKIMHYAPPDDWPCHNVAFKLQERAKTGQKKYGTNLARTDLARLQWLIHAQEEAMDLANYLQVLILQVPTIQTRFDDLQDNALAAATELEVLIEKEKESANPANGRATAPPEKKTENDVAIT